jgi:hypothetical protein
MKFKVLGAKKSTELVDAKSGKYFYRRKSAKHMQCPPLQSQPSCRQPLFLLASVLPTNRSFKGQVYIYSVKKIEKLTQT